MTTPAEILAATTFRTVKEAGVKRVHVVDRWDVPAEQLKSYSKDVVRITVDERFALISPGARSYRIVVRVDGAEARPYGDAEPTTAYRELPTYWRTGGSRSYGGKKLPDVIAEAAEITAQLAGKDAFGVELPVELEHVFNNAVALRARWVDRHGKIKRSADSWEEPFKGAADQLNRLRAQLGEAAQALHPYGKNLVESVLDREAAVLLGETSFGPYEAGKRVRFVGDPVDLAQQADEAYSEAVQLVLDRRANIAQGVAELQAERAELLSELVTTLAEEATAAELRAVTARDRANRAAFSAEARELVAQEVIDRGSGQPLIGHSRRTSYRVCEQLARIDRDLELAANDREANTVLLPSAEAVFAPRVFT